MSSVATAMVLAAGLGTRMRPLTGAVPKPLVELAGKTLIDHVLDRLAQSGVTRAVVNLHYMADQIEAHLMARKVPKITISDERECLLDTGGGVARALPLLGAGPFFIHNSDSFWIEGERPCLGQMIDAWDAEVMDALLLLAPVIATLGYDGKGDFHLDANGKVYRSGVGQMAPYVFTGVSIAAARLFDDCPEWKFSLNVVWDRAIAAGRVWGLRHGGTWMHVGTPDAVLEAASRLRQEAG